MKESLDITSPKFSINNKTYKCPRPRGPGRHLTMLTLISSSGNELKNFQERTELKHKLKSLDLLSNLQKLLYEIKFVKQINATSNTV